MIKQLTEDGEDTARYEAAQAICNIIEKLCEGKSKASRHEIIITTLNSALLTQLYLSTQGLLEFERMLFVAIKNLTVTQFEFLKNQERKGQQNDNHMVC